MTLAPEGSFRDDAADLLKELRSLRSHLGSTDSVHHHQNTKRLEALEGGLKEQNELLQRILLQTAGLDDMKRAQSDHAERIDQLESDKDKVLGAKAVIAVLAMGGAGAIGAWIKSIFDPHAH